MTAPPPRAPAAPSAWKIERVATALLRAREAVDAFREDGDTDDSNAQLSELALAALGIRTIVERLLLAGDEAKSNQEAISRRIDALRLREQREERHENAWRDAAMDLILAFPEEFPDGKFKSPIISASVRAGKPGVVVTNEAALPDEYVRVKREPDKAKIRDDLLQGVVIDGAELRNPQPYITVRTK